jgi:hypothetical protein
MEDGPRPIGEILDEMSASPFSDNAIIQTSQCLFCEGKVCFVEDDHSAVMLEFFTEGIIGPYPLPHVCPAIEDGNWAMKMAALESDGWDFGA